MKESSSACIIFMVSAACSWAQKQGPGTYQLEVVSVAEPWGTQPEGGLGPSLAAEGAVAAAVIPGFHLTWPQAPPAA